MKVIVSAILWPRCSGWKDNHLVRLSASLLLKCDTACLKSAAKSKRTVLV